MSAQYPTLDALNGAIDSALRSLLVTPPDGAELTVAIGVIRVAAAYVDHTGATAHSAASIAAAVNSYALAEDLELRDGVAEQARLAAP